MVAAMRVAAIFAIVAACAAIGASAAQSPDAQSVSDMARLKQYQAAPADDQATIAALERGQLTNPPYFLFELARRIYAKNPAKAGEWFMVALSRDRYDGLRCKDATSLNGIGGLGRIAPEVAARLADKAFLSEAVAAALSRQDLFAGTASPAWVCLHGIAAAQAGLEGKPISAEEMLVPPSAWPALQTRLRQELAGFAH